MREREKEEGKGRKVVEEKGRTQKIKKKGKK